jgi:hypothetical protein
VTSFQLHSVTRDLAVGRLDDLGGFADRLIPDTAGSGSARARSAAWSRAAAEGRRSMATARPSVIQIANYEGLLRAALQDAIGEDEPLARCSSESRAE